MKSLNNSRLSLIEAGGGTKLTRGVCTGLGASGAIWVLSGAFIPTGVNQALAAAALVCIAVNWIDVGA